MLPDKEDFFPFPRMARLSREVVITEKLDGTNAQVFVYHDGRVVAGSRNRWLTPDSDNFGFAAWVEHNKEELLQLGPGRHFGEWWGSGIQRGYGLSHKKFSLFNATRWEVERPSCCEVVPVLYRGIFDTAAVDKCLDMLREGGSWAAPGFMQPEGVVVYHVAGEIGFKKTLEDDDVPKSVAAKRVSGYA